MPKAIRHFKKSQATLERAQTARTRNRSKSSAMDLCCNAVAPLGLIEGTTVLLVMVPEVISISLLSSNKSDHNLDSVRGDRPSVAMIPRFQMRPRSRYQHMPTRSCIARSEHSK